MFIFAFIYYLLLFKHHDLEASSPTIWLATRGASFFHITFVGIDPLLHHSMTMNPPTKSCISTPPATPKGDRNPDDLRADKFTPTIFAKKPTTKSES